ncbi:ZrgA family zinc uptake protein [Aliiglaciecola lipolytica]|uniref:Lipoprotein n=1 Tax=Aliiglaciecola lipolytica E3 TaxID=1127673 RepID=K6YBA2_9ALTE|nr:hypothetical protein [Aliiglaciecola lipolytica]GAC13913.1 hypothetical protein GLIP_1272 [Aliiglaciecola lipolytica E3]
MKKYPQLPAYSLLVTLATLMTGCDDEVRNPLCSEHKTLHQQHLDSIATMVVKYTEDGQFTAQLNMPLATAPLEALAEVDKVIQLEAEQKCQSVAAQLDEQSNQSQGFYTFACGTDNKLTKVTVKVLENFPALEEVEVWVETPAVNKHFVLNRQCERPLFNL